MKFNTKHLVLSVLVLASVAEASEYEVDHINGTQIDKYRHLLDTVNGKIEHIRQFLPSEATSLDVKLKEIKKMSDIDQKLTALKGITPEIQNNYEAAEKVNIEQLANFEYSLLDSKIRRLEEINVSEAEVMRGRLEAIREETDMTSKMQDLQKLREKINAIIASKHIQLEDARIKATKWDPFKTALRTIAKRKDDVLTQLEEARRAEAAKSAEAEVAAKKLEQEKVIADFETAKSELQSMAAKSKSTTGGPTYLQKSAELLEGLTPKIADLAIADLAVAKVAVSEINKIKNGLKNKKLENRTAFEQLTEMQGKINAILNPQAVPDTATNAASNSTPPPSQPTSPSTGNGDTDVEKGAEAARIAAEAELERKAKEEEDARLEAERRAKEEARLEAERKQQEEARLEAERKQQEAAAADRLANLKAEIVKNIALMKANYESLPDFAVKSDGAKAVAFYLDSLKRSRTEEELKKLDSFVKRAVYNSMIQVEEAAEAEKTSSTTVPSTPPPSPPPQINESVKNRDSAQPPPIPSGEPSKLKDALKVPLPEEDALEAEEAARIAEAKQKAAQNQSSGFYKFISHPGFYITASAVVVIGGAGGAFLYLRKPVEDSDYIEADA